MRKILLATTIIIAGFVLSSAAMAQSDTDPSIFTAASSDDASLLPTNIPWHPAVDEVDQRDDNQQIRIEAGEANGQLSQAQAAADQARLYQQEAIQQQQEAAHGGHLTLAQQHYDNVSLNRTSTRIFNQRHR